MEPVTYFGKHFSFVETLPSPRVCHDLLKLSRIMERNGAVWPSICRNNDKQSFHLHLTGRVTHHLGWLPTCAPPPPISLENV